MLQGQGLSGFFRSSTGIQGKISGKERSEGITAQKSITRFLGCYTGSETVVTYELGPHRLALCTSGLGCLRLTPSLEKVVGSFVDHRLFLPELLPGFLLLPHNCILHLGFPTGKGFDHPPKGPFVYLVPSEF